MSAVFGNSQSSEIPSLISELDIYLGDKLELSQVHPIEWWRTYESQFPNLSHMARDYVAIPATSVPSECCFSIAGSVLTKSRSSMTEGMTNALMCCKYWLGFDELCQQDLSQLIEAGEEVEVDITIQDEE